MTDFEVYKAKHPEFVFEGTSYWFGTHGKWMYKTIDRNFNEDWRNVPSNWTRILRELPTMEGFERERLLNEASTKAFDVVEQVTAKKSKIEQRFIRNTTKGSGRMGGTPDVRRNRRKSIRIVYRVMTDARKRHTKLGAMAKCWPSHWREAIRVIERAIKGDRFGDWPDRKYEF